MTNDEDEGARRRESVWILRDQDTGALINAVTRTRAESDLACSPGFEPTEWVPVAELEKAHAEGAASRDAEVAELKCAIGFQERRAEAAEGQRDEARADVSRLESDLLAEKAECQRMAQLYIDQIRKTQAAEKRAEAAEQERDGAKGELERIAKEAAIQRLHAGERFVKFLRSRAYHRAADDFIAATAFWDDDDHPSDDRATLAKEDPPDFGAVPEFGTPEARRHFGGDAAGREAELLEELDFNLETVCRLMETKQDKAVAAALVGLAEIVRLRAIRSAVPATRRGCWGSWEGDEVMPYVGKSMDRKRNARRRQLNGAHTAESWNSTYPVGTAVRYWPVYPPIDGIPPLDTSTRSEAWTLGDGSVVVLVVGKAGGVHLSHVEVLSAEARA